VTAKLLQIQFLNSFQISEPRQRGEEVERGKKATARLVKKQKKRRKIENFSNEM
jgi:hypothetical protein